MCVGDGSVAASQHAAEFLLPIEEVAISNAQVDKEESELQ